MEIPFYYQKVRDIGIFGLCSVRMSNDSEIDLSEYLIHDKSYYVYNFLLVQRKTLVIRDP